MNTYTTLDPSQLDPKTVHQHLLSAVVPRPICFASTIDAKGNINLSPFSFFNVFSSNPPILIFSPSRSGRDNSLKHTLTNVMEVDEVVINIIDHPMVEQMSLSSTPYKKGVNEFVKSGLTPLQSTRVIPPRVGEAPIAFECKVQKTIPLGENPGAGNLVIAEVLLMHFQDRCLNSDGTLAIQKINWVARMGGSWYAQIRPEALFQIPKPNSNIGIGVDQLPQSVQNSIVLTGNNLGRLGNLDRLPTQAEINQMKQSDRLSPILSNPKISDRINQLHQIAQQELAQKKDFEALTILLVSDQIDC